MLDTRMTDSRHDDKGNPCTLDKSDQLGHQGAAATSAGADSSKSIGVEHHVPNDRTHPRRLGEQLRALQAQPSASVSLPPEITAYLRILHTRVGFINLFHALIDRSSVPLQDVYAPLGTELAMTITVVGGQVTNRSLTHAALAGLPAAIQPVALNAATTRGEHEGDGVAEEAIVGRIQAAIDRGADSKYQQAADRPLILAPPWYDGTKEGFWPLGVADVAALYDRLVLIGPPGSGKSTFARYFALCLLAGQLNPPVRDAGLDHIGPWPHSAVLPVYVELRRLFGSDTFVDVSQRVTESAFWGYVKQALVNADLAEAAAPLRRELLSGHGVVILDGIDEVPMPPGPDSVEKRRGQIQDLVHELSTVYAGGRIILTCRDYAYRDWTIDGFETVRLSPLGSSEARALVLGLCSQRGLSAEQAEHEAEVLLKALAQAPSTLTDYPLFLALMAAICWNSGEHRLPARRASLYGQSIALLLNRWSRDESGEASLLTQLGCDLEILNERLEKIAYETHISAETTERAETDIEFSTLVTELFRMGQGINTHAVLAFLTQQAGVIVAREPEVFQFAHRGFQEYLAASYLFRLFQQHLRTSAAETCFNVMSDHLERNPLLWREPGLLLGDIVCEGERRADIWRLLEGLVHRHDLAFFHQSSNYWWSVWLAARIVEEHQLYKTIESVVGSLRTRLIDSLVALLSVGALPTRERAEAAVSLGMIGDPRRGVGASDGIPDIVWCHIPAGQFVLGTSRDQIKIIEGEDWAVGWTFSRETPASVIDISSYFISKYTITECQFQVFVEDPDGYSNSHWWNGNALTWWENAGRCPAESEWSNIPNLPKTNVNWYEAFAFCLWISDKIGRNVRLPTEVQWEKAARGTVAHLFPWGDQFESQRCNSNLSGLDRPAPVGCFAQDLEQDELDAAHDMSGNVWEWCSTIAEHIGGAVYSYPYSEHDGREDQTPYDDCYRVVRGGSYINPPFLLRGAYRGRDISHQRLARTGFRVVLND